MKAFAEFSFYNQHQSKKQMQANQQQSQEQAQLQLNHQHQNHRYQPNNQPNNQHQHQNQHHQHLNQHHQQQHEQPNKLNVSKSDWNMYYYHHQKYYHSSDSNVMHSSIELTHDEDMNVITDETITNETKRSQDMSNHLNNSQTPSSVYNKLSTKSGLDFAPVLKLSRKSGGSSFIRKNPFVSSPSEKTENDPLLLSKDSHSHNVQSTLSSQQQTQSWKLRTNQQQELTLQDESPPPTPPVRDSSLIASRKRANVVVVVQMEQQNEKPRYLIQPSKSQIWSEKSKTASDNSKITNLTEKSRSTDKSRENSEHSYQTSDHKHMSYRKHHHKFPPYEHKFATKCCDNVGGVVGGVGYSKSLVNLQPKYESQDSVDDELKQHSQTFPLLPDTPLLRSHQKSGSSCGFNQSQSWSSDYSVESSCTGIASLVTSSDYYTASSCAMTHSPSLSSLDTTHNHPISTSASFNFSRNSISSASSVSSSQIARSAKVEQPKRQEVYSYDKSPTSILNENDFDRNETESPPPPPLPPKLRFQNLQNQQSEKEDAISRASTNSSTNNNDKMVFLDPSKKHKTSNTEIKAIQKRALYQFYLKQIKQDKQGSKQDNLKGLSSSSYSPSPDIMMKTPANTNNGGSQSSPSSSSTSSSSSSSPSNCLSLVPNWNQHDDILAKKVELIARLSRKLEVLRSEEQALSHDIETNESLGLQLMNKLKMLGISNRELDKISLHCDATEKVTRLLLSLSARLQLIEIQMQDDNELLLKKNTNQGDKCLLESISSSSSCALQSNRNSIKYHLDYLANKCQNKRENYSQHSINSSGNSINDESKSHSFSHPHSPNKNKQHQSSSQSVTSDIDNTSHNNDSPQTQFLMSKREKLLIQLEEALQLRESIEKRSEIIGEKILRKYFGEEKKEDTCDFLEFFKLKSKLIVDLREIRDKIELGDKRLKALEIS